MASSHAEALAIFKEIDQNGDGLLCMEELTTRLDDFGMSQDDITSLFVLMDKGQSFHFFSSSC